MQIHKYLRLLLLLTVLPLNELLFFSLNTFIQMGHVPNRIEIIEVFKYAIKLNEDFKQTVSKIPLSEHKEKRYMVEKYHEEVLSPTLVEAVKLFSSGEDLDLAIEFCNVLISYENSSDEQLSFSLGEVFYANPELIEKTFLVFERTKQQFLYRQLEWGFENVIYYKDKSDRKIINRIERLRILKSKVYGDTAR